MAVIDDPEVRMHAHAVFALRLLARLALPTLTKASSRNGTVSRLPNICRGDRDSSGILHDFQRCAWWVCAVCIWHIACR